MLMKRLTTSLKGIVQLFYLPKKRWEERNNSDDWFGNIFFAEWKNSPRSQNELKLPFFDGNLRCLGPYKWKATVTKWLNPTGIKVKSQCALHCHLMALVNIFFSNEAFNFAIYFAKMSLYYDKENRFSITEYTIRILSLFWNSKIMCLKIDDSLDKLCHFCFSSFQWSVRFIVIWNMKEWFPRLKLWKVSKMFPSYRPI